MDEPETENPPQSPLGPQVPLPIVAEDEAENTTDAFRSAPGPAAPRVVAGAAEGLDPGTPAGPAAEVLGADRPAGPAAEVLGTDRPASPAAEVERVRAELSEARILLERELAVTERLHRMTAEVMDAPATDIALEAVLSAALELVEARSGKIQLVDPGTGSLAILVEIGADGGFPAELRSIPLHEDLVAARAFRDRRRVAVEDTERDPLYERYRAIARRAGYRSVQSTPLVADGGERLGVLTTHRAEPHRASEREGRLLDLLGRHAADLIVRRRSAEAVRELSRTLEERVAERTRAARESERRFQALVHASAQIVWTADASGAVVEDSPSWRAATGQSLEERIGQGWLDAFHPDDRSRAADAWRTALELERPFDIVLRLADGMNGWPWTHVRAVPLSDDDGVVSGWVGMCSDVSERKHAEAQLRRVRSRLTMAEQQERRRIATVLHDDLQQRLFGIQMKMTMASQSAEVQEWRRLEAQIEEAQQMIDRAVATTRQLTVDLSPPVLPGEGLAEALTWLRSEMAEMHGLDIDLVAEHAFPIPDEDMRVLLFQVGRELLLNVAQHAETDQARMVLREDDGHLLIAVEDEGRGFDTSALDQSVADAPRFGLLAARERLGLFGGRLEVESSPGIGTKVTAFMPVVR